MCGIVSIFVYDTNSMPVNRQEFSRSLDRMLSRGPDGCGEWFSPDCRVGLGHRRLAIIDLSETGTQPMRNREESLVITFNGEIYNYLDLRKGLERKGYRFTSNSDTEVLLHLYAEKGAEMVHDLRGMFAFAIWDDNRKGLFLARDPFGIKPLYYADDGRTFRAASQVKALLAGGSIDTSPEPAGHVGFFLLGYVPDPFTLYRSIRSLPAGTSLWVGQDGRRVFTSFCSISKELANASFEPSDGKREDTILLLRQALVDSVAHHLIADVPVGIFLSAGLDSTTLAVLAAEIGQNRLNTITLGFREYEGTNQDEVPLAETMAREIGADHHTIWVERHDFHDELERLLDAMDQPTIDGVNSYFVSKAAANVGLKVAISGLGGDELFGSYPSFRQIPRTVGFLEAFSMLTTLGRMFRVVSAPILKHFTSQKYAGLLEYGGSYGGAYLLRRGLFMPWEIPDILDGDIAREGWGELQALLRMEQTVNGIKNSHLKVSALEMCWYMRSQLLRDADWAGMAHSLEIRVPLVDMHLLRKVSAMFCRSDPPRKRDMALTPERRLPAKILCRQKSGFSVPTREWLMDEEKTNPVRGMRSWSRMIYKELWR